MAQFFSIDGYLAVRTGVAQNEIAALEKKNSLCLLETTEGSLKNT